MCGIAGIIEFSDGRAPKRESLEKMCSTMLDRGPDELGLHIAGNVGFGMRRLSIIDVEGGQQPIFNENRRIWTVSNGEIYNYPELCDDLARRGHVFRSMTDTEVIPHAYEEYGIDFLKRLNGMFGLALWDEDRHQLFLARDRVGIKPLYYYHDNERFVFASELTAILACREIGLDLEVDPFSLNKFFIHGYMVAPYTMFKKVRKLMPGQYLALHNNRIEVHNYWNAEFVAEEKMDETQALENFDTLFRAAVKRHLISDVPLGAFLSGGIDSTIVTAVAAQHMDIPVKTFTIGYTEASYDESRYARQIADYIGSEYHEIMIGDEDLSQDIMDIMGSFDEPFYDSSGIPMYYVSKMARTQVKAVLSGDGGDELFIGYNHHRTFADAYAAYDRGNIYAEVDKPPWLYDQYIRVMRKAPNRLLAHHRVIRVGNYLRRQYIRPWNDFLLNTYAKIPHTFRSVLQADTGPLIEEQDYLHMLGTEQGDNIFLSLAEFDFKNYLPNDILTKVDRMTMRNSLEARVPLLDYTLVEFAAKLPLELKIRGLDQKYLLKQYMRKYLLPEDLYQTVTREKHGFRFPLGKFVEGPLKAQIDEGLRDPAFIRDLGLCASGMERILQARKAGRVGNKCVWLLFCLFLWWHKNLRK